MFGGCALVLGLYRLQISVMQKNHCLLYSHNLFITRKNLYLLLFLSTVICIEEINARYVSLSLYNSKQHLFILVRDE